MSRHGRRRRQTSGWSRRRAIIIGLAITASTLVVLSLMAFLPTPQQADVVSAKKLTSGEIEMLRDDAAEPREDPVQFMNDDALPAAAVSGDAIDRTAELIGGFEMDVSFFGEQVDGAGPLEVSAAADECLTQWALTQLPALGGVSGLDVQEVCGQPTAVLVGGRGVEARDMLGRAAEDSPDSALARTLFGHPSLAFVSVSTTTGDAVLIAASPR